MDSLNDNCPFCGAVMEYVCRKSDASEVVADVKGAATGVHHLKVRMASKGNVQVDWLSFE